MNNTAEKNGQYDTTSAHSDFFNMHGPVPFMDGGKDFWAAAIVVFFPFPSPVNQLLHLLKLMSIKSPPALI